MSERPLRVAQWAAGNIGSRALRELIQHPRLELVGALVYDRDKDGVDAGSLCGTDPVGVTATTDPAAIHALHAHCVLYMPRTLVLDDVVASLESGANVVTTRGEFFARGVKLTDDDRSRVLDACERRNTSIYATGSSPGFITDALTSSCRFPSRSTTSGPKRLGTRRTGRSTQFRSCARRHPASS